MKALTLTAPYGTLITVGAKHIETRSWSTSYRGRLAIHQGSNLKPVGGRRGLEEMCGTEPFFDALYPIVPGHDRYCDRSSIADALPLGAIVAVCELVECWQTVAGIVPDIPALATSTGCTPVLDRRERAFGDYTPGRYAWVLTNVRALPEPIPIRGQLGLWELNDALLQALDTDSGSPNL